MSSHDRTILVVDDDPDLLDTVCDLLSDEGWHAVGAESGERGLAILAGAQPPALVLLDLMMPGMNGREFLVAQRRDPALADVPVVLMTASRPERNENDVLRGVDVLLKPIPVDELLSTVHRFVPKA